MKTFFIVIISLLYNIPYFLSTKLEESLPIIEIEGNLYVQLKIGDPNQEFNVLLSTIDSMSWIPSSKCDDCKQKDDEEKKLLLRRLESNSTNSTNFTNFTNFHMINTSNSSSSSSKRSQFYEESESKSIKIINQTIEINNEEVILSGKRISESIQLGHTLKAKNFHMVLVEDLEFSEEHYGKSGLLGLSNKNINGNEFGLLFSLKQLGNIDKSIFSIGNNRLLIGNYPSEIKQFPEKYNKCNVTLTLGLIEEYMDSWVCDLSHVLIGSSKNFSHSDEVQGRVVFDSLYKKIQVPIKYLSLFKDKYFNEFFKGKTCNQVENKKETVIQCLKSEVDYEKLPEISFIIGGFGLIIPGNKLFSKVTQNKTEFNIHFSHDTRNFIRMGRLLLDEYLVVYDNEENTVGFFGDNKKNFQKEWMIWWNSGFSSLISQEYFKYLVVASVSLGGAILLVIVCLVVQGIRNKKKESSPPLYEEEMNNV